MSASQYIKLLSLHHKFFSFSAHIIMWPNLICEMGLYPTNISFLVIEQSLLQIHAVTYCHYYVPSNHMHTYTNHL